LLVALREAGPRGDHQRYSICLHPTTALPIRGGALMDCP
jgi:hypothetical protein